METRSERRWNAARTGYVCADGAVVAGLARCLRPDPYAEGASRVIYPAFWGGTEQAVQALVGGVIFDRTLSQLGWIRDRPRTFAFPRSVRRIDRALSNYGDEEKDPRVVRLNEGLEALQAECFDGACVARVYLSDSVREICESAFYCCQRLSRVDISSASRLEAIGKNAFGHTALEAFAAPEGLRRIGAGAFAGCGSLARLDLNEGLEELGVLERTLDGQYYRMYGAFEETALERVALPGTLRALGASSFRCCARLAEVVFAEGLELIGPGCFWECPLREARIPASVVAVETGAFHGCRELRAVSFAPGSRLRAIGAGAFAWTALEEFAAPAGLVTIAQEAFLGCRGLRRVTLNEGLEALGTAEQNQYGERLLGAFQDSGVREVRLPRTLREIRYAAFKGCGDLEDVLLPEGLRVVGEEAFSRSGLRTLALPESLATIGGEAFYRCAALAAVAVPEESALEEVGSQAFTGTGIREVRFPAGALVAEDAFETSEDE